MTVAGTAGGRGALQAKWGYLSAKRPPAPAAVRLLRARRHEEHAVDLVPRRLVLDAVRDAPDAAEAPLEEVGGVVEDEPLDLGVDLGALLLVQRGAPLDDQVVQGLVAVIAVGLATLHHVVEDGIGIEDRVVAPRPLEHGLRLAVAHEVDVGADLADVATPRADPGLGEVGDDRLGRLWKRGLDDRGPLLEAHLEAVRIPGLREELLARGDGLQVRS